MSDPAVRGPRRQVLPGASTTEFGPPVRVGHSRCGSWAHAFKKTAQATSARNLELARTRLREVRSASSGRLGSRRASGRDGQPDLLGIEGTLQPWSVPTRVAPGRLPASRPPSMLRQGFRPGPDTVAAGAKLDDRLHSVVEAAAADDSPIRMEVPP